MTAVQSTPNIVGEKSAAYAERVVAWNVKMLLTARGESQAALARALGIQRSNMTSKMKGRVAWSLADVVKTAIFLDTTPESLLDDSLMKQFGVLTDTKKAGSEEPASDGLLRLGLNQRPSDKQFYDSMVSIDPNVLFTVALALWGASLRFAVLDQ